MIRSNTESALDTLVKTSDDSHAQAELGGLRRIELSARALVRAAESHGPVGLCSLDAAGAELEAAVAAIGERRGTSSPCLSFTDQRRALSLLRRWYLDTPIDHFQGGTKLVMNELQLATRNFLESTAEGVPGRPVREPRQQD